MDCSEVLEQLSDYLDEEARDEICRAIKEHLEHCHNCQVEVDTVNKTILLYRHDGKDEAVRVPVFVTTQLQAALAKEYRAAGESAASD